MAYTVKLASAATKPMNNDADTGNRIFLTENLIFEGQNDCYEILTDERIAVGGESQVFKANRISDGQLVVAKIYDEFQDTKTNRACRKTVINFLLNRNFVDESGFLPLLDYGYIELKSCDGEEYNKPIDIIPYCDEGEIKSANYEVLKTEIIPQVTYALYILHRAGIIHRDIKVGNLCIYDGMCVVADFGTASEANAMSAFTATSQKRGTLGYTAPEVWQGYATAASDFYSFGCTIASLYKGEHPYQSLVNIHDEAAINKSINTYGLPIDCPEKEKDLQILVDALTIADETKRAGYDDIILWLNNFPAFEQKFKGSRLDTSESAFEFDFENVICRNPEEMVEALASNWEKAKPCLYRGGVKDSVLINFFSKINPTIAIRLGDIIEDKETATNYDLGLAKALHYIDNSSPICWKGKIYEKLSDISIAIEDEHITEREAGELLMSGYISWKLENSGDFAAGIINDVKMIESIANEYRTFACYYAAYKLAANPLIKRYRGYNTVDELIKYIIKEQYDNHIHCTENDKLLAFLAFKGFLDNVLKYKQEFLNSPGTVSSKTELMYRLFEDVCINKKTVREWYYKYGTGLHSYPQLHYEFWREIKNINFKSTLAKTLKRNILCINFSPDMLIDDLSCGVKKIDEYRKNFRNACINIFDYSIFEKIISEQTDIKPSKMKFDINDCILLDGLLLKVEKEARKYAADAINNPDIEKKHESLEFLSNATVKVFCKTDNYVKTLEKQINDEIKRIINAVNILVSNDTHESINEAVDYMSILAKIRPKYEKKLRELRLKQLAFWQEEQKRNKVILNDVYSSYDKPSIGKIIGTTLFFIWLIGILVACASSKGCSDFMAGLRVPY